MGDDIISLLDQILSQALEKKASDIHLEPREDYVRLRYRVDGILEENEPLHKNQQAGLVSRIKVLANLDISESRLPQDGRINLKQKHREFDLRISILPTVHGEKAVIRMLERRRALLKLTELGMSGEDLLLYRRLISKRSGLILVSGPTGSGKTTTLYATLRELNCRENNIMTIEDPVEYQLPGINQTQVNPKAGLTFPKALRTILRQDPDIILIGEIRDLETARIAVQSALTGHLVFSTLHTKDAPSAVIRLTEMGIEPYLIEDVLLGAVAQRLIRVQPSGRRAIFEIMCGSKPNEGFVSLEDKALHLIRSGLTTGEEVARVLDHLPPPPPPPPVPPAPPVPEPAA